MRWISTYFGYEFVPDDVKTVIDVRGLASKVQNERQVLSL